MTPLPLKTPNSRKRPEARVRSAPQSVDLLAARPSVRLRGARAGYQQRDHAAPSPEAPPGLHYQLQQGSQAATRRRGQGQLRHRRQIAERQ
jgi:hypothetical protein